MPGVLQTGHCRHSWCAPSTQAGRDTHLTLKRIRSRRDLGPAAALHLRDRCPARLGSRSGGTGRVRCSRIRRLLESATEGPDEIELLPPRYAAGLGLPGHPARGWVVGDIFAGSSTVRLVNASGCWQPPHSCPVSVPTICVLGARPIERNAQCSSHRRLGIQVLPSRLRLQTLGDRLELCDDRLALRRSPERKAVTRATAPASTASHNFGSCSFPPWCPRHTFSFNPGSCPHDSC